MSTIPAKPTKRIHPKMFLLWIAIGSIIMMFAGLTSAYIVRRMQGNWEAYQLPTVFWVSSGVIILSSICLFVASANYKRNNYPTYRNFLSITLLLGILFCVLQYKGWQALTNVGILLSDQTPSGAFLYVISGLHALHVLGGVVFLLIFWIKSLKLPYSQEYPNLGIDILSTYWHFIGILWLYLFGFFMYYQ